MRGEGEVSLQFLMRLRRPKRFWKSLSLSIGAIDQLAVGSLDAFTG